MGKTLKTSSCTLPIDQICMKCQGNLFSKDESTRQEAVIHEFKKLPPDCVSSSIDGIKCPFITGKAYMNGNRTQKIPQHGNMFTTL